MLRKTIIHWSFMQEELEKVHEIIIGSSMSSHINIGQHGSY